MIRQVNELFDYRSIACSIEGLRERGSYNKKIMQLCTAIITASLGAVSCVLFAHPLINRQIKNFTMLGSAIASIAASICYFLYRKELFYISSWHKTLSNLGKVDPQITIDELKTHLKPDWKNETGSWKKILKKESSNSFAYLFVQEASARRTPFSISNPFISKPWNTHMCKSVFGVAMLAANTAAQKKYDEKYLPIFNANMEIVKAALTFNDRWIFGGQEALYNLRNEEYIKVKDALKGEIPNVSVGSELLLSLVSEIKSLKLNPWQEINNGTLNSKLKIFKDNFKKALWYLQQSPIKNERCIEFLNCVISVKNLTQLFDVVSKYSQKEMEQWAEEYGHQAHKDAIRTI